MPVLAFIVVIIGPNESGIGDYKFKTTGVREIATIATVLLILKLVRDAARILTVFRFSELSIDLSDASKLDSFVNTAYLRPSDLFRAKYGGEECSRARGLLLVECTRTFLLWTIAILMAAGVFAAIGSAVQDMLVQPVLAPPTLSYGIAALTIALLAVAGHDFLAIGIVRWPRMTAWWGRRKSWKAKVKECEREAAALALSIPSPWPPLTEDQLKTFRKEIELYKIAQDCEREAPRGEGWGHLPDPWPVPGPYSYSTLHTYLRLKKEKNKEDRQWSVIAAYNQLKKEIDEAEYLPDKPTTYFDESELWVKDVAIVESELARTEEEFSRIKAQYAAHPVV